MHDKTKQIQSFFLFASIGQYAPEHLERLQFQSQMVETNFINEILKHTNQFTRQDLSGLVKNHIQEAFKFNSIH